MKNLYNKFQPIFNPNRPGYLIFYVTNRCNFRCNFCFYSDEINKGLKPDELSVQEIEKISKKTGPLIQISLTGGEPFLRKEFTEIAEIFLINNKPVYFTVVTNGSLNKKIKEFFTYILPKYPKTFFRLAYSIEGIGEKHDLLREVKGSYDKIISSFEDMKLLRSKYKNFVIDSNSVFTKDSEDGLLDTLKYLYKNFSFDNLSVTYARGKIKDEKLKKVSSEKFREINNFINSIKRNKETRLFSNIFRAVGTASRDIIMDSAFNDKFNLPCVAGKKIIIIYETGDVHPCEILNRKLGNLKDYDYDLNKLLKNQETKETKKWIKDTKCKCTFECAASASVVWNVKAYPKLLGHTLKSIARDN